jgi:hypothetical protein
VPEPPQAGGVTAKQPELVPFVWTEIDTVTRKQLEELDELAESPANPPTSYFLSMLNSTAVHKTARKVLSEEVPEDGPAPSETAARKKLLHLCSNAAWDAVRQRFPTAMETWNERSKARLLEEDRRRSPWRNRPGWEIEKELPILTVVKRKGQEAEPVEPGYELYNDLVGPKNYRPFRTTAFDLRVAVPTKHGLRIWNPVQKEGSPNAGFVAAIGYAHYTLRGDPVPRHDVDAAVMALVGRALEGDLPAERVVELWVRFAPDSGLGGRIDMADPLRRCIVISPEGWRVEDVGHPTFDPKAHMRPLPIPEASDGPEVGWRRVEQLWKFVPIANETAANPRLLVLADQVQQVLGAASPKTVKIITGEEGIGKSTIAGFYQALLDPSTVEVVAPPSDEEELINLAMNHATINLDNVSYISSELSDNIARLSTGIGLTKRKLFSDNEEVSLNVLRSVILNGITASPRAPDLLRRCLFLPVEPPKPQLARDELKTAWKRAHPKILGGLLDLAVLTARVLRDNPPPPCQTSMADYVRVGQAMSIAMGLPAEDFVYAWNQNESAQHTAAADDPWVSVLNEYFERLPANVDVRSEDVASWINLNREGVFGKSVIPQHVGQAIARTTKTLRRLQIHVRSKVVHGHRAYYRFFPAPENPETAPPAPPAPPNDFSSFVELQDGREGVSVVQTGQGGPPENEVHPSAEPHPNRVDLDSRSTQAPPTRSTQLSSSVAVPQGGAGDPLSTFRGELGKEGGSGADPEDLFAGVETRADRARRTWESEREKRKRGEPTPDVKFSELGPFVEYPGGTVTDRATGEVVWSPGDPPEARPSNPERGQSTKPHTKRSF